MKWARSQRLADIALGAEALSDERKQLLPLSPSPTIGTFRVDDEDEVPLRSRGRAAEVSAGAIGGEIGGARLPRSGEEGRGVQQRGRH